MTAAKRIYLAGPDVFFPAPRELGERKKALCNKYGFEGAFPLDGDIDSENKLSPFEKARAISIHLENMMDNCDLLIANLTPFRSVSMDVGTAFEVGYMRAQGKPVLGYTNIALDYYHRVENYYQCTGKNTMDADLPGSTEIEDFGLVENLMIEIAITESAGKVIRHPTTPGQEQTELGGFEKCLMQAEQICGTE